MCYMYVLVLVLVKTLIPVYLVVDVLMEARADRVLGLVKDSDELLEVELSVRAMVGNDVLNVLVNATQVHVLHTGHRRKQAHGLCTCVHVCGVCVCVTVCQHAGQIRAAARHHNHSHMWLAGSS